MAIKYRSYAGLPLVLTVEDLMSVLQIGRNAAYELVCSGAIGSFRIGKQIRITKESVKKYLETMDAHETQQAVGVFDLQATATIRRST